MAYSDNIAWNLGQSLFPSYYGGAAGAAAAPGSTGTLTGAAPRGYTSASGGIPGVPSPQATQATAIGGNIAALPQLTGLAGDVNAFNLGEVTKQYQAGIPQYNAMTAQSSGNILAALQGQVPGDVVRNIQQGAAERGIATGSPGGPNANAAYLRALGLTSLGQQQYGEQALTGAVARMPRTALYNPASEFVTPAAQQEAQYMANVLASAAVPQDAYNQALIAAQMGQNRGYNAARSPGTYQPAPGVGGGNVVADIINKYNPFATGTTSTGTGTGTASLTESESPGYSPFPFTAPGPVTSDQMFYPDSTAYGSQFVPAAGGVPGYMTNEFGMPITNPVLSPEDYVTDWYNY